jgi:hypothetical protein
MAKLVLRDCFVMVNNVTFSDHVSSVELSMKKDDIDVTSFSGAGRTHAAGLSDCSITLNFQQDFAATSVDITLYPLWVNETTFITQIRPTSAAASATNPTYYAASCILLEYAPLSGKVGELSETSVQIMANAPGSLIRYAT